MLIYPYYNNNKIYPIFCCQTFSLPNPFVFDTNPAAINMINARLGPIKRHYLPLIYIYIYTELAPKLTATISVAQTVERWSRDPGSRVQFPAGGLGVAFFATGPGLVLKMYIFWHSNLSYFKKSIWLTNCLIWKIILKILFPICRLAFLGPRNPKAFLRILWCKYKRSMS